MRTDEDKVGVGSSDVLDVSIGVLDGPDADARSYCYSGAERDAYGDGDSGAECDTDSGAECDTDSDNRAERDGDGSPYGSRDAYGDSGSGADCSFVAYGND